MSGEEALVARLRRLFSDRIGDDAAVVENRVYTTDMLVEDIDFTRAFPLRSIARKSIAVNLSDIAAMGARPRYALLSLALPEWARDSIDLLIDWYAEAAREYRVEIIGGDLSRAAKLTISVTAVGELEGRALLRSGARAGDRIYVSRPLGGSAAGLQLLLSGAAVEASNRSFVEREFIESAVRRHLEPEPEVALGLALAAVPEVTSCIDVSDGLSTELHHICRASGVGALIEKDRIPVFEGLTGFGARNGIDVRKAVLHGGEEYALVFTSKLPESQLSRAVGRPVYSIGRVRAGAGVVLLDSSGESELAPGGWDHFRAEADA